MASKSTKPTLDTLIEIEGKQMTVKSYLRELAKTKKYKAFPSRNGELAPVKFAELLFEFAVNGKELDESLAPFSDDVAEIAAIVTDNAITPKSKAEIKAEADAAKAEEDKKAAEELALVESNRLAQIASFGESIKTGAEAAHGANADLIESIRTKFPSSIKVDDNGHVEISPEATVEEIGAGFGATMQLSLAVGSVGNTLTFMLGELAVAAVNAGVYASMKECAKDISHRLAESGVKALDVKTIENYARVSSRIEPEDRNPDVSPTVYHIVANVKQPKKRADESDASFTKREKTHKTKVKKVLKDIKEGKIASVKDAKTAINTALAESGTKEVGKTSGDYAKIILELTLLGKVVGKSGNLVGYKSNGDDKSLEVTKEMIAAGLKSATARYVNLRGFDPKQDLNISELVADFLANPEAEEA